MDILNIENKIAAISKDLFILVPWLIGMGVLGFVLGLGIWECWVVFRTMLGG